MARILLKLNTLINTETESEAELSRAIEKALEKRIPLVEILLVPGCKLDTDTDRKKKHILRFLARPEIKILFYRVIKGGKDSGRIFVHFRHENLNAYHN